MKAEHAILTTATVGPKQTGAPFWVKAVASLASVAMLLAVSSYNVVPTLKRAVEGDTPSIGLAAVQIAFTIILAIIPFVPGWSSDTRKMLTLVFMLGNGWFAFEIAGHRHDGERTAINQQSAWKEELTAKQAELAALGNFTPKSDYDVTFAQEAERVASADRASVQTSADTARAQFATCEPYYSKKCKALEEESKRLADAAKQKDAAVKAAHGELQTISGLRTLTLKAEPIKARIDKLQQKLGNAEFVADTGTKSEAGCTIEALLIALLIEIGNRFGPEAAFKFIFFAAGFSLVLPLTFKGEAEEKSDSLPSIALPAVPHVETAPAAPVIEPRASETPRVGFFSEPMTKQPPTPLPPSGRKRTRKQDRKAFVLQGGNIIPFAKKPTQGEVLALVASGKTQKEAAAILHIGERTVRRIVAASKSGHVASMEEVKMAAS